MEYAKPLPKQNGDTRPFWEACRQHQFKLQYCLDCGERRWPPAILCPQCLSRNTEWRPASGRGILFSWVVYHVAYHPGFSQDLPYVAAVVELEEGPLFLTNLIKCDPGTLQCGMPVALTWDDVTPEVSLPKFTLAAP